MKNSDWPAVAEIYQQGMDTGFATFEKVVPSFEVWDASHLAVGRLVAVNGETILGWAALSPVSSRCVYGGVAEVSVYIGQGNRGQGVGKMLMQQLIVESEKRVYGPCNREYFRKMKEVWNYISKWGSGL